MKEILTSQCLQRAPMTSLPEPGRIASLGKLRPREISLRISGVIKITDVSHIECVTREGFLRCTYGDVLCEAVTVHSKLRKSFAIFSSQFPDIRVSVTIYLNRHVMLSVGNHKSVGNAKAGIINTKASSKLEPRMYRVVSTEPHFEIKIGNLIPKEY
ncbi:unnamed protein product [Leptidea sinapis]|uniref:Uncharacterized protein n=1 Tax=Leptidea sinapis TaxID=189913 RepID=A0A5E4QVI8_9NEOP|nr:unnamed protein product [Leptidea sinapis]